jgi:hypothetical protein
MKLHYLFALLLYGACQIVSAFDTKKASTDRFTVVYVEPKEVPPLSDLPSHFTERAEAIRNEEIALKRGDDPKDILQMRQLYLRQALYPIRATDKETGIIYEVQSDRRTITATKPDGTLVWKVNPFVDAKLEPYRFKHPFIVYFGKTLNQSNIKEPVLGIAFNSSQGGVIELESGKFHFGGND